MPSFKNALPVGVALVSCVALSAGSRWSPVRADSPPKTRLQDGRVETARAQLAAAEAKAARTRELVEAHAASAAELDEALADLAQARADFAVATGRPDAARSEVAAARARVAAAQAQLERTKVLALNGYVAQVELGRAAVALARAQTQLARSEVRAERPSVTPPATPAATPADVRPGEPSQPFESARAVAQARLDLARGQYEVALRRMALGREISDEELYLWSKRWMEAEQDVARKRSGRLAAAEAHLARMREIEERARARYERGVASQDDVGSAQYHRLEAEQVVLELKRR